MALPAQAPKVQVSSNGLEATLTFKIPDGKNEVPSFTAAQLLGFLSNANVTFVGDLPTKVESTIMEVQKDDMVYDLNGRRVEGQLPKGIYIKNGRKFVVR